MRPCPCQAGPSSKSLKAILWACSRAERRLGWALARVVLKELAMGSLLWSLRAQFLCVTQRETEAQRFFGELLRGLRTSERDSPQHFLSIIPRPSLIVLVLAEPLLLTSPQLSVSPVPRQPPTPPTHCCSEAAGSGAPDFAEQAKPEVLSLHKQPLARPSSLPSPGSAF